MATRTIERSAEAARELRLPAFVERWLIPLALCSLALVCYLLTLSDVHTFDALSYIRDVDQRAGFFFHPHHLLYSPTGWLFWQLWRLLGYDGNSELALKVLNSLAAAGCGFGLYRLTLGLADRWWAATLAAGVLLFNYGVWYFGVEVEVYHLALVWLLAALALMVELLSAPRPRTAPLLGLCLGLAALYHQTNGLLVPVVVAAFALSPAPPRSRVLGLLVAGAVSALLVALGYAVVALGINGIRTLSGLEDWMFFFVRTGWWGVPTRDRLTDLGAGLGNTISTTGALPFWIAIVALLLAGLPLAARRWPRIVALCGVWVLLYGAFFYWWEGENIEFWIATLMPLWLLLGLSAACLGALGDRAGAAGTIGRTALAVGCVVLPLLLARHNYPIVERRGDAAHDLQRQLADKLGVQSSPQDMIISTGGVLELYLPYYEDRHFVRTFNMVLFETGGDLQGGFGKLQAEIETALHAGLAVYVGRDALELPPFARQRYNLTQADLDAFWAPYRPALEPAVEHDGTVYFWRFPPARELAGAGWRWEGGPLGWQSANVDKVAFDAAAGGWCFNPAVDPALVSPLVGVEAADYGALEVTMRTLAPKAEAQLFFAGPDGAMSDERSVRWTLDGDGRPHTYTVRLADQSGWQGSISRLRLDPVAVGDGSATTRTCVEQVRLIATP